MTHTNALLLFWLILPLGVFAESQLTKECDSLAYYKDQLHDEQYFSDSAFSRNVIDAVIKFNSLCGDDSAGVIYELKKTSLLQEYNDFANARHSIKRAYAKAAALKDSLLICYVHSELSEYYYNTSAFDSCVVWCDKALRWMPQQVDSIELSNLLTRKGIIYDKQGINDKALALYLQSLEICEAIRDTAAIGQMYNNIAIIYKKQNNLADAQAYYQKALDIAIHQNKPIPVAICHVNIGLMEKDLGHLASADSLLNHALSTFRQLHHEYGEAAVLHNLGELKYKETNYTTALSYIYASQKLARKNKFGQLNAKNNIAIAQIYLAQNKPAQALEYIKTGKQRCVQLSMLEDRRDAEKIMSEIYEKLQQPTMALAAFKMYHQLQDSLFNNRKTQIINQLKTRYHSEQKDAEINFLVKEKSLQKTALEASNKKNKFFIFLSIALFAIFLLLAYGYFRIKNYNRQLNLQQAKIGAQKERLEVSRQELLMKNEALVKLSGEKDELISIVAHDLRSPLNQISGLSTLLRFEIKDEINTNSKIYFDKIDEVTGILLKRINKILDVKLLESKSIKVQLTEVKPVDIISNVQETFTEIATKKDIRLKKDAVICKNHIMADYQYVMQIMENLVSNAIKFSEPGKDVFLGLSETDSHVRLHVKDQGPGLKEEDHQNLFKKYSRLSARPTAGEKSIGLGLAIVKKYVRQMNGRVWCESTFGHGAEFIVEFAKN